MLYCTRCNKGYDDYGEGECPRCGWTLYRPADAPVESVEPAEGPAEEPKQKKNGKAK